MAVLTPMGNGAAMAAIGALGLAGCLAQPASEQTIPTSRSSASITRATVAEPTWLARLPAAASVVRGKTIVLNPGHNGGNASHPRAIRRQVPAGFGRYKDCDTTGTQSNAGYTEHAFTWDVALRVRKILLARGVRVIMTRPSDRGVGPCVDQRARIGNRPGVAGVISIHADGAPSSGHGFHVSEASRHPNGAAVAASSHRLTVAVHDALRAGSRMTTSTYLGSKGYYPRSDLSALNLAKTPATFAEIGNMRNAGDSRIQASPVGRQRIAAAVAQGILRWLAR